jgi:hypothetical protein
MFGRSACPSLGLRISSSVMGFALSETRWAAGLR